jgi:acyl-coenzyme A synthetase/AMP-(fatty) acid ligase
MESANAADWFIDRHVRAGLGGRLAFQDPWHGLTYAALARDSARFASALRRAGIGRERLHHFLDKLLIVASLACEP